MVRALSNLMVAQPWYLLWSLLALLPLLLKNYPAFPYPTLARLPADALSLWVERAWRLLGALAIVFIAIGLSGIYWTENMVERVGSGAHVMIVLDRSASMNDDFADPPAGERESKMAAARRVLQDFVSQGKEDLLGMVTFSTSPILAAPLGGDREAVLAGLQATEAGGMGFTAVARGLGMALEYYKGRPVTGSRAVLLVSDGGAYLDAKTQEMLRNMFQRENASLFWLYLRSANGASLKVAPAEGDEDAYPEYQLHRYFGALGTSYRVYEADNPLAVERALQDISRLKNKPVRYTQAAPRLDLSWLFYLLALLCAGCVLALHLTEIKQWRNA